MAPLAVTTRGRLCPEGTSLRPSTIGWKHARRGSAQALLVPPAPYATDRGTHADTGGRWSRRGQWPWWPSPVPLGDTEPGVLRSSDTCPLPCLSSSLTRLPTRAPCRDRATLVRPCPGLSMSG